MAFRNIPPNGFPAIPDIEDLEAVVKDVTTLKTATAGLAEDVGDLEDQKANQITIALPFNPETEYEVGDLVYYNGLSYRCTNAHTGEWDADDFAGTTIANELSTLKSGLIDVQSNLTGVLVGADAVQTTHTVNSAYLTKNGMVVVCTAKLTLTSDITSWSTFAKLNLVTFPNSFNFLCEAGGVIVPAFVTQGGNIQLTQGQTLGTEITMTFATVSA